MIIVISVGEKILTQVGRFQIELTCQLLTTDSVCIMVDNAVYFRFSFCMAVLYASLAQQRSKWEHFWHLPSRVLFLIRSFPERDNSFFLRSIRRQRGSSVKQPCWLRQLLHMFLLFCIFPAMMFSKLTRLYSFQYFFIFYVEYASSKVRKACHGRQFPVRPSVHSGEVAFGKVSYYVPNLDEPEPNRGY